MKNSNATPMSFAIMNNVELRVVNKKSNTIVKTVRTHNKATRLMVTGILRFIEGLFTPTVRSDEAQYDPDVIKMYIPCYFNVGDGGVVRDDQTGLQIPLDDNNKRIPELVNDWTEFVNYSSYRLDREIIGVGTNIRTPIRSQQNLNANNPTDTLDQSKIIGGVTTGDMDSLCFTCEIQPGQLNTAFGNNAVFVTEVGLFAGADPSKDDLLAHVKLGNYKEETETGKEVTKTNALYIRPDDTLMVRWVITIAAIGKDNILHADIQDEDGKTVQSDIVKIPDFGTVEIIEHNT